MTSQASANPASASPASANPASASPASANPVAATTVELSCQGRVVADYQVNQGLPADVSPRPFLFPVRTLAGTEVTELMPPDHLHHLGVGVAVPDVAGQNFWGGRTFVRGQGPTRLANHGVQQHVSWSGQGDDHVIQTLSWRGADGRELLRERRAITALPVAGGRCWALDLGFTLTNPTGAAVTIGSPATNGRPGAGYGGFFWRAPGAATNRAVFSPTARGEDAVHGSRAAWVALAGTSPGDRPWTLVFLPGNELTARDRWFVRDREYPAVGSALAWDQRLAIAAGASTTRRVVTVVADGRLGAGQVRVLVGQILAAAEIPRLTRDVLERAVE
ncbi:DUF6807 domain-containing protein [Goodfellowiella coeruleoviolacea]|uniref:Methane oxygenase PmoA n=1 Tax=Goodfellowiella coeruleoviolacea TaxID=334858 RepID=A0AAE3GEV0_9PSEU|nr:PmoA family protein [Goodfellowiella coeruleoviolacea]MCP2166443.1 Methane oxygenase PmoA [Goodfellowiella coeruleoviolacea]